MSHDEYLHLIRQNPDDDRPRLDYADWLSQNGDPRGEFIRIQCQLAGMDSADPAFDDLLSRQNELLNGFEDRWIAGIGNDIVYTVFHRGFVECVCLRPNDLSRQLDQLYTSHAVSCIREMNVGGSRCGDKVVGDLVQSRWASYFVDLDLHDCLLTAAGVKAILNSPHVSHVQRLTLANNEIGDDGLSLFAKATSLPNLAALNLMETKVGDKGVESLAKSDCVRNLSELDLRHNRIGPKGIGKLSASNKMSKLSTLLLEENKIGDAGLRSLMESPYIALAELVVNWNEIGDEGLTALAKSQSAKSLISLDLRANEISDRGLRALAESKNVASLKKLLIDGNRAITSSGQIFFSSNSKLAKLEHLAIDCLDDEAATAFANTSAFPKLRSLDLQTSELSDSVLSALRARYEEVNA